MNKIILLILIAFVFLAIPVFACTPGTTQCANANTDTSYRQVCDSSAVWGTPELCDNGCDTNAGDCFACTDGDSVCIDDDTELSCVGNYWSQYVDCALGCDANTGKCISNTDAKDQCTQGETYCYDAQDYVKCAFNGTNWVWDTQNLIACNAGQFCDYNTGSCASSAPAETCSTPFDKRCDGDIVQECSLQKEWVDVTTCTLGCIEIDSSTVYCSSCELNARQCFSSSEYEICDPDVGAWSNPVACPTSTPTCQDPNGQCVAGNNNDTNSSDGNGDNGGSTDYHGRYTGGGSGGGPVTYCINWTDWKVDSKDVYYETDENGVVQECTKSNYIKYCMDNNQIDKTEYKKDTKTECVVNEAVDECNYVYDRTEDYTDKSDDGYCRDCYKEILVYSCYPSGITNYSKTQEKEICSDWGSCDVKEFDADKAKKEIPFASLTLGEQISRILSDYGLLFGLLLLILIAVGAYIAYSKMSDEDEPPENPDDFPPEGFVSDGTEEKY